MKYCEICNDKEEKNYIKNIRYLCKKHYNEKRRKELILARRVIKPDPNSHKYGKKDKPHIRHVEFNKSKYSHLSKKERSRASMLWFCYKMTLEEYKELWDKQEGRCWICLTHEKDLNQVLNVDHCHKTGEIRGLLCNTCNRAIGYLKDNTSILRRAFTYLNRYQYTIHKEKFDTVLV